MKWRCPQCGKPHDRNDPPCDNCGHHKLERAVVPQAEEDEDHESFVWACTACGRHHQRNNPPCKRCGNPEFEKEALDYENFEIGDTRGYRQLAGRQEAKLAVVLLALVSVGVLGYLGVVTIPGITPPGPPTVADVPGDADRAGSVELDAVEAEVLAFVDQRRSGPPLERDDGLDATATYLTRRWVKDGGDLSEFRFDPNAVSRFDTPCDGVPSLAFGDTGTSALDAANATEVAARAMPDVLEANSVSFTNESVSVVGVDAHTGPDGVVYTTLAYC